MYNVCNAGFGNRSGCGGATYQTMGGGSCGCMGGTYQRVCRDACGNLFVRNTVNCNPCCCCQQSCCGCGNNNSTTGNNGTTNTNGVFRCVTFCGYDNGNANANARNRSGCNCAASYYARQYGLTCDDDGECAYNFTND